MSADQLFTCVCVVQRSCSKAYCPRGDYPRREGLNEIQRINCSATNGSFHLFYRGEKSAPIYFNNTKAVFKRKVEEMTT